MTMQQQYYHDDIVKRLVQFSVAWAVVGMTAGVYVAAELLWPTIDFGQYWLSFGRLRPLHTNGIIFGFGVSALSFLTAMFFLVKSATVGSKVQGWTSLMVLVSFLCGFIIIVLGVVGEYLARMMNQLSAKKSYHVRKVINR